MPNEFHGSDESKALPDGHPGKLADEQVARLADLIAEGRFEFPSDLSATDIERLRRQVQALLRNRLVRFIARAVAHYLHRATQQDPENSPHA